MRRRRNKDERRRQHSTSTVAEQPVIDADDDQSWESERIPDVLVRTNYTLLIRSATAIAVCLAVVYVIHSFQLRKNASRLKDRADAAEAAGNPHAAIKHLSQFLSLQREAGGADEADPEQTETLSRLANLQAAHAETFADYQNAYDSFESVLRNDPTRRDDRRQLVDVCMKIGRFRDALQHLELLNGRADADADTHLLLQEARAHVGLRKYQEAQQSFCRLIEADPTACEPYISLAQLVTSHPESLWYRDLDSADSDEESTGLPSVVQAFPSRDEPDQPDDRRQAAMRTTERILDALIKTAEPSWDALRRRALFLISLPPDLDATSHDEAIAQSLAERLMSEWDRDGDGIREPDEPRPSAVPAFADVDHNGTIDQQELVTTLEQGGLTRRLEEAERSLTEALALVERTGEPDAQAKTLSTATRVYAALAENLTYEDYERSTAYVRLARDAADRAVSLSDRSPESLLALARFELQVPNAETSTEERQERLDLAESLLSEARDKLTAQITSESEIPTEEQAELQALLIDIEMTLGSTLIAQIPAQPDGDAKPIKARIRNDIIPSLEKLAGAASGVHFLKGELLFADRQWRQADAEYTAAVSALNTVQNSELHRQIGLRRAACAQQLGDSESSIARTLAVHQADPNWSGGRIRLAQVYAAAGSLDAARAEYARYWSHPSVTPALIRVLLGLERAKPFAERNWSQIDQALEALEKQKQNAALVPIVRSEVLYLQAVTDQQAFMSADGSGLDKNAQAKLQQADQILRKGIDDFPDDAEIRITLSNFTVQRFDLSTEDKIQQSDAILRRAHDQLGDSVPLRLATAMATRLLSDDEQAIDALQELQLENPDFTPRDRANLLSGLAQFYVGRGRRELAIDASIEAATLVPTEISYPQAALGHIIGHLIENKGKIDSQQSNWDAMVAQLAAIEGPDGPLTSYFEGTRIVLTIAGEPDHLTDPDVPQRLDQARSLLRMAQQARPRLPIIPRMLGELEMLSHRRALQLGDASRHEQAAMAHFERAVELGDLNEMVVSRLAAYYLKDNRESEVMRLTDRIARERPEGLSKELAMLAWQAEHRLKEENPLSENSVAIDEFIKKASDSETDADAKIRSALMAISRGETGPEVEKLLLEACRLEPQAPGPWEWTVRYYAQVGRQIAAVEKIDEAKMALAEDPPYLKPRTIAHCYQILARTNAPDHEKQQWIEQAEPFYQAAIEADPGNMSLHRELAEFYMDTSQLDKAQQILAKILDPKIDASRGTRQWAEHNQALVTASGGTFEHLTRALETLRRAELDTDEQRIFNLRTQLDVLARRNRVADRPEMIETLKRIRDLAGERFTLREHLQLASLYEAVDNWQQAEAEYQTLLKRDPGQSDRPNAAILGNYALGLLRQTKTPNDERLEQIARLLDELKENAPSSWETALIEARLLHARGQSADAVPVLLAYLETLNFESPVQSKEALRELVEQKDVDRAVEVLQAALRSTNDEALARIVPVLERLLRERNTDEALAILQRYQTVSELVVNVQTEMHRVVAELFEGFGQIQAAEDLYRQYIRKSARPVEASLALVGFLGRQNRTDEALDQCEKLWNQLDDPTRAASNCVALLRRTKPTDQQIARVEKLLTRAMNETDDPQQRIQYQVYAADLRDVELKTSDAIGIYERILAANDRNLIALNNLAWMLAFQPGREAHALTLINRAIELAGPLAALRDTRAVIYIQTGKPQKAIEDLTEAINQAGDDPTLWFHLAQARHKAGDREGARDAFRTATAEGLTIDALHRLDHASYRALAAEFGDRGADLATRPNTR